MEIEKMKTTYKWILLGGITISGLLLLLFAGLFFSRIGMGYSPIVEGHGALRNGFLHLPSASVPVSGWLALAGGGFLLMVGGIWLGSRQTPSRGGASPERKPDEPLVCPGCGKDAQANWNLCPYCGYELP